MCSAKSKENERGNEGVGGVLRRVRVGIEGVVTSMMEGFVWGV